MVSRAQIVQQLLDAIPDVGLILNDKRQIVAANSYCLKVLGVQSIAEIIGKRTGEAVNCLHAFEGPMGCGTSEACRDCGAAHLPAAHRGDEPAVPQRAAPTPGGLAAVYRGELHGPRHAL